MAGLIYGLCTLLALACSVLLLTAWRRSRYRLLLWGGLFFAGVTLSNAILVVDKVFLGPEIDLAVWRYGIALIFMIVFIIGLIWDTDE